MALVGSISSSLPNSLIGVSGTVIVSNRADALFPSALPGSDVSFFVSGSRGGKGSATERSVSVFGGDAVVSGSLTIGTGSLLITSNDVQFSSFSNRITLHGSELVFFDGSNTDGKTLSALVTSAGGSAGQVQFNSGGALSGEGTFTYSAADDRLSVVHVAATAVTASHISAVSTISGSSNSVSDVITIKGDIKLMGNDILDGNGSLAIQMKGDGTADVKIGGDLIVGANEIKSSAETAAIILSDTDVTVVGDLTVTGNDIKSSGGTTALSLSGNSATVAGNLAVTGDLTVNGTTVTVDVATVTIEDPLIGLGFSSGSVATSNGDRGFVGGIVDGDNVAVFWDNSEDEFAIARTTSNPNATAITVASYGKLHAGVVRADSGLSGSLTRLTDGTSAFIAGTGVTISSASNGAVTIGASASGIVAGSNTHVQFNDGGQFGASSAFTFNNSQSRLSVVHVAATSVTASHLSAVSTISGSSDSVNDIITIKGDIKLMGNDIWDGGGSVAIQLEGSSDVKILGDLTVGGNDIKSSGGVTSLTLANTGNVTVAGDLAVNGGDITTSSTTASLFQSTVTSLVIGGVATSMQVGANNVNLQVGNTTNSSLSVATGSLGLLTVAGASALAGGATAANLVVAGTGSFGGAVSMSNTLNVSGLATLASVTVAGASALAGGATAANLVVAGTGSFGGAVSMGSTLNVAGAATFNGAVDLGNASNDDIKFYGVVASNILPSADRLHNLGSPNARWNNIYTGDLHLRNERGNWTVIEEETYLSIRNNNTGKMYKFVLEEVVDSAE